MSQSPGNTSRCLGLSAKCSLSANTRSEHLYSRRATRVSLCALSNSIMFNACVRISPLLQRGLILCQQQKSPSVGSSEQHPSMAHQRVCCSRSKTPWLIWHCPVERSNMVSLISWRTTLKAIRQSVGEKKKNFWKNICKKYKDRYRATR